MPENGQKIALIGVGALGAPIANALMLSGLVSELVLIDEDREKSIGEAMDLKDANLFTKPVEIYAGSYGDCKDAQIIIYAAGTPRIQGLSTSEQIKNKFSLLKEFLNNIPSGCGETNMLIVTRPVDVLTYAAYKISGWQPNRILGLGTVLETFRFRKALSDYLKVNPRNTSVYVVGEQDNPFPLWNSASVAGVGINEFVSLRKHEPFDRMVPLDQMRSAAYDIIFRKGGSYLALSMAVCRICQAILKNENTILTVAGPLEDVYGISGVAMSLPSVVNRKGREKALVLPITPDEEKALASAATALKKIQSSLFL